MSVEDIQNVLDDQIVRTQAMRGSRYVKPFEARTITWEKTLNDLQDIMDNWLGMQGNYQVITNISNFFLTRGEGLFSKSFQKLLVLVD